MEYDREDLSVKESIIVETVSAGNQSSDDFPAIKRRNPTPILDRLSELPDLAINHILSNLCFKESARTSLLSKRFKSLWNSVTGLNFTDVSSGEDKFRFLWFVDTALCVHRGSEIEKFSIKCGYNFNYAKVVDRWIQFATEKQVKLLHLSFRRNLKDHEYQLPKFLYSNDKLIQLVTNCCKFTEVMKFSWNSLKLLSIGGTKLNEGLISRVLSGCPVLETLELRDWSGCDSLKINTVGLRVLRIVGEQQSKYIVKPQNERLLEISGPNLVSLEISGRLYRSRVCLMDVGSLVSATMDFETWPKPIFKHKSSRFVMRDEDITKEVLGSLCFVKKLYVGRLFIKVLSRLEAYNLSSPLSERKSLTVSVPVNKWNHHGIASLLHNSPYLEALVIRLSCCSETCGLRHSNASHINHKEYYWTPWLTISKCPLKHLKTVKVVDFHSFCGKSNVVPFLRFLLRYSSVLQELVIQASQFVTGEALHEAMKLLSLTTASPDVVIRFEPPQFWVDPLCIYQ